MNDSQPRVAVLAPCYNEATTIAAIVRDCRAALPAVQIKDAYRFVPVAARPDSSPRGNAAVA